MSGIKHILRQMTGRYILAILLAAGITIALFIGMRYLIIGQDGQLSEPPKGKVIDFVRLQQDETVQTKKRMPKKPPKPEEPPPDMAPPQAQQESMSADTVSMSFDANINSDTALAGGLALDSGDGEYLPIFKVQPIYPRRALSRGLEGYVIVEFNVTKNGSVSNPVVVEANPPDIFNQSALEAAKKFKYKPRVIDGEATEVVGVQNKITFQMKR
jgi:protein TonB